MKRRARGFTLLEVIIAFALLGLALTLLLGSLSGGARQVREAELRTRAILHAQSLLAETGVATPLQVGSQQGDWEQGRYHWELQVQPWVEPRAGSVVQSPSAGAPGWPNCSCRCVGVTANASSCAGAACACCRRIWSVRDDAPCCRFHAG